MVAYGIAKARAKAWRTDWNERTEITKAIITWVDSEYEYELEIENEDRMDNEEFTAWVEENAESLAKADAESLHTVCEEIDSIDFTEKEIDDDYAEIFRLTGLSPRGIAYAGPTPNYTEEVIRILEKDRRLSYGRTIDEAHGFSIPTDFFRWNPTCQFRGDELLPRAEEFFNLRPDSSDALFFVWGHSYEFDLSSACWDKLEYFCKEVSSRKDVTCLTCSQFYDREATR